MPQKSANATKWGLYLFTFLESWLTFTSTQLDITFWNPSTLKVWTLNTCYRNVILAFSITIIQEILLPVSCLWPSVFWTPYLAFSILLFWSEISPSYSPRSHGKYVNTLCPYFTFRVFPKFYLSIFQTLNGIMFLISNDISLIVEYIFLIVSFYLIFFNLSEDSNYCLILILCFCHVLYIVLFLQNYFYTFLWHLSFQRISSYAWWIWFVLNGDTLKNRWKLFMYQELSGGNTPLKDVLGSSCCHKKLL